MPSRFQAEGHAPDVEMMHLQVDTEEYTVENAMFRLFDVLIRKQLDPVWHRLSPKTKQLASDLSTLRSLLGYLLQYDSVTFLEFLETIVAAQTPSQTSGSTRQNQSPWLLMDAANTIFSEARRRVYMGRIKTAEEVAQSAPQRANDDAAMADANDDDEDALEALREMEGARGSAHRNGKQKSNGKEQRPHWLPDGIEPVLEELPKWHLLRNVLREIEEEIQSHEDEQCE